MTRNILLINIVMYIATMINQNFMISTFAMFYPASPLFRIWQPVTYLFMHGGFWHLFFNMFCLLMFGSALERTIGSKKYLIFYFVAGLGAVLTHTVVDDHHRGVAEKKQEGREQHQHSCDDAGEQGLV